MKRITLVLILALPAIAAAWPNIATNFLGVPLDAPSFNLANLSNGQVPVYNSTSKTWKTGSAGGSIGVQNNGSTVTGSPASTLNVQNGITVVGNVVGGVATIQPFYGTGTSTVAVGNDSRFNAAPSAAGQLSIDTGAAWHSITAGASNTVLHGNGAADPSFSAIVNGDVTNATLALSKLVNATGSSKVLGSGATGAGSSYAELSLGTNLSMTGTTINAPAYGSSSGTIAQGNDSRLNAAPSAAGKLTIDTGTAWHSIGAGAANQLLHGAGAADPTWSGIATGDIIGAAVTLAKIQNAVANQVLLGSASAGAGSSYQEITLGSGLSITAGGQLQVSAGSTIGVQSGGATVTGSPASTLNFNNGLQAGSVSAGVSAVQPTYGSSANTVTQGNDSRLNAAPSAAGKLTVDTGSAWHSIAAGATNTVLHGAGAADPSFSAVVAGDVDSTITRSDGANAKTANQPYGNHGITNLASFTLTDQSADAGSTGVVQRNGGKYTYHDGTRACRIPHVIFPAAGTSNANIGTVANLQALTSFGSILTLVANDLTADSSIEVDADGVQTGASVSTQLIHFDIQIGGTTVCDFPDNPDFRQGAETNQPFHLNAKIFVRSAGLSGTVLTRGTLMFGYAGTTSAGTFTPQNTGGSGYWVSGPSSATTLPGSGALTIRYKTSVSDGTATATLNNVRVTVF